MPLMASRAIYAQPEATGCLGQEPELATGPIYYLIIHGSANE